MKNRYASRLRGIMAFITLMLLPGSCLEYSVTTSVNRDGSIVREYTVRGDSSDIFTGSLRIPSGNFWKITNGFEENDTQKKASERQYFYTASRKFKDVDELNEWLATDTSSSTIKIKVNLKKRFRWFYTYYQYTELYPMSFPFKNVPVDSFLTDIEQSVIMEDGRAVYSPNGKKWIWNNDSLKFHYNNADSSEMKSLSESYEKRMELWMTTAAINEFADIVINTFIHEPVFSDMKGKLLQHEEFIRSKFFYSKDTSYIKALVFLTDSISQNKKLSELFSDNPLMFKDFEKKIESVNTSMMSDNYEYNLSMPGQVFSTNASGRDPQRLTWKFEQIQFFMKDFEMKAESRVANPWIMVVSGIMAVFLVIILVSRWRK